MAYGVTRSGTEYSLIDQLLATSQTTRPSSKRLQGLRGELLKDQMASERESTSGQTRASGIAEGLGIAERLRKQGEEDEERKRRLAQATGVNIKPKFFSY